MKPDVLYHASTNMNIKIFEPRDDSIRSPGEGKRVFATPDQRVAAMFLAPKEAGRTEVGVYGDKAVIVINATPGGFKLKDKGGAIYTLPGKTFTTDPVLGMGAMEWTSRVAVRPLNKKVYASALEAMQRAGVKIYFVDDVTFDAIGTSEDQGWSIIESLHPYVSGSERG